MKKIYTAADLQHDEKGQRYFITDDTGTLVSYLDYRKQEHIDPPQLIFHYVFTPPDMRGRGLAKKLSFLTFDSLEGTGHDIVPTCPYVRAYYTRWKQTEAGKKL